MGHFEGPNLADASDGPHLGVFVGRGFLSQVLFVRKSFCGRSAVGQVFLLFCEPGAFSYENVNQATNPVC